MCLGDYSKFGAGRSCQVLLVGGDKAYQEELAVGLELLGLSIVTATSAGDALAIVTQNDHVGVVITDIRVPGMSDLELATRILSARHTEQSVEVIILANYIAHRVRQEAKRLGIFACLDLSSSVESIAVAINAAMANVRKSRPG